MQFCPQTVEEVKPVAGKMPMTWEMQFTLYLEQCLTQEICEKLGGHIFIVATHGVLQNYCCYWAKRIASFHHNLCSLFFLTKPM